MPYKIPTPEDVRRAYDQITEDGPEASNPRLSVLAVTDPVIRKTMERLTAKAIEMGIIKGDPLLIQGFVSGALVWALHLGIHLGRNQILDTLTKTK